MSQINRFFYKNRLALNVLANSPKNAKAIVDETEGHAIIGVLSKDYDSVKSAVAAMKEYDVMINGAVSVGLGGGDNRQAKVVAEIVKTYVGAHINQVFTHVGATYANANMNQPWINALVSPTGKLGYVNISTGPISADSNEENKAIVPVKAAIRLVRDMGGQALKFFPMKGLTCRDEYIAVAKACGEEGFALEPTGGINLENFEEIITIALDANVPKIVPHVYSSIIDKASGATRQSDVAKLYKIMQKLI